MANIAERTARLALMPSEPHNSRLARKLVARLKSGSILFGRRAYNGG
jgi:hypothetical protein